MGEACPALAENVGEGVPSGVEAVGEAGPALTENAGVGTADCAGPGAGCGIRFPPTTTPPAMAAAARRVAAAAWTNLRCDRMFRAVVCRAVETTLGSVE